MARLINISEAVSIAVHSLGLIANSKDKLNVNKMSEILGFSKNHMSKIMQILVKFNYLKSTRGPNGGFVLKKEPKDITLLEIYELIEGNLQSNHCGMKMETCPFGDCVFGGITEKLTKEFKIHFENRTLKDISYPNLTT